MNSYFLTLMTVVLYLHFVTCQHTISFTSRDVYNEYIISFRAYQTTNRRHQLLADIMAPLYVHYFILEHASKCGQLLSTKMNDFDVIKVYNLSAMCSENFIHHLTRHKEIKSVSLEKRLQRRLSSLKSNSLPSGRRPELLTSHFNSPFSGTLPLDRSKQPWRLLNAKQAWSQGLCGSGVRVGIFDTGFVMDHPHFNSARIKDRTDWTKSAKDNSYSVNSVEAVDGHGHGTFVTGLIAANPILNTEFSHLLNMNDSSSINNDNNNNNNNNSKSKFLQQQRGEARGGRRQLRTVDPHCPPLGLAPNSDLFIFRVFTDTQLSYTSWFLDAFNYAIQSGLHVINLSVGGPDFLDQPFVEKVLELSANGILLVSAIGNDGPLFGTLNNPADQMDVLGVGGIDAVGRISRFSSRGMTHWELPFGYGRVKPDVVAYSTGVMSSSLDGKCSVLSGTSVASPIVTGVVILLINIALNRNANNLNYQLMTTVNTTIHGSIGSHPDAIPSQPLIPINPASIKQVLIAGSNRLDSVKVSGTSVARFPKSKDSSSIFEQGAGLVNLTASLKLMSRVRPQASLMPSYLDLTECPYMWPYCSQPFYSTMIPVIVNVTIFNSMAVTGFIKQPPIYHPFLMRNGHRLKVEISYSKYLWPWVGYMALHLSIAPDSTNDSIASSRFSGKAEGYVSLTVESFDVTNNVTSYTNLRLPLRVNIVPKPDRSKRILFDQFHNLNYPSGFIPRDDLVRPANAPLDWLGDHIHSNYLDVYMHLRKSAYYVELLNVPLTCFNASNYGVLILLDSEEEFHPDEINKLEDDVLHHRLSVIVFADWYNTSVMRTLEFYDTNTRRLWTPDTGGANLPALNNLLRPFNIEFGDAVYAGDYKVGRRLLKYHTGSSIRKFPNQNLSSYPGRSALFQTNLVDLGAQYIQHYGRALNYLKGDTSKNQNRKFKPRAQTNRDLGSNLPAPNWRLNSVVNQDPHPIILGVWTPLGNLPTTGRLAVYGDSDCLSSTHLNENCFWLLDALLQFSTSSLGKIPRILLEQMFTPSGDWLDANIQQPARTNYSNLRKYSNVIKFNWKSDSTLIHLPPEAYRPLPSCKLSQAIPVETDHSVPDSQFFSNQPLLLYSESELRDDTMPQPTLKDQCHLHLLYNAKIANYLPVYPSANSTLNMVINSISEHYMLYLSVTGILLFLFRKSFKLLIIRVIYIFISSGRFHNL